MATVAKQTLEGLVTRYRREIAHEGASPELEVRIQDLSLENFAGIYDGLVDMGGKTLENATMTLVVSTIMDQKARGEGIHRHLSPMRIREIYFENGVKTKERFVRKEPLVLPFRVPSNIGLSYVVALSSESESNHLSFSSDESALIRVKARVSFPIVQTGTAETHPELAWRVDLTVSRMITGSDASTSLKHIVATMFKTKPAITPKNFLNVLNLRESDRSTLDSLYRFEAEAEFVGTGEARDLVRPADITAVADTVLHLANPGYAEAAAIQSVVYRAARYVVRDSSLAEQFQRGLGMKRLLPQATAMTRATYRDIYPPTGYFLTDKADGKRALGAVYEGRGVIAGDVLLPFAPATATRSATLNADTIVDGELVFAADGAPTLYAFDVIVVAGVDVTRDDFAARLAALPRAVAILREAGVPAEAKLYTHLAGRTPAELRREIEAVHGATRPYSIDGLIFVKPGDPYADTSNEKWKPAEHNTIDFLVRRAPPSLLGKAPYIDASGCKLHMLFVGISSDRLESLGMRRCPGYADLFGANSGPYNPIQFAPSDAPFAYLYQHPDDSPLGELDGQIVEGRALNIGATSTTWEMVRIRDDRRGEQAGRRYFGNDFYVAEMIWLNYVDPFPIDQLWTGPADGYFLGEKLDIYRPQTAAISFVKSQRIRTLAHVGLVVDLGAGNGQDIGRYIDAGVRALVAVDRDRAALAELVRRKYSFADRGRRGNREREHSARSATTIYTVAADIGAPAADTVALVANLLSRAEVAADAVVCNLAVHYWVGSLESLRNFVVLARTLVKVGGTVVISAMFGEKIVSLLREAKIGKGDKWNVYQGDVLKYSLHRLYASETLQAVGQKIGVLLPFSSGTYYEEYLVNTRTLKAEFEARDFELVVEASMDTAIADFEARNTDLGSKLTADDRRYIGLYGELVFRRTK